ncbi:MAG: hypothetical protein ACD_79C01388G0002 [uncultured bacterium]|nr:MAG: hypothetical protein ACD_79C01388G0002 [uncultured bacterium]
MKEFDQYCDDLLEQSKRFLEIAKNNSDEKAINAYLNAALLISISSLEASVNSLIEDFYKSKNFTVFEIGLLNEKEIVLKNGIFSISNRFKMSRLTDKIELLAQKFSGNSKIKHKNWWSSLCTGILLINEIAHPKKNKILNIEDIERTILSVIQCIDFIFRIVYKKSLPSAQMELQSKMNF